MALNSVPPVTLPPCIIFSFTGFQIFDAGRRVERRAVLPGRRVERPLIDRARRRDRPRVAVLAGRRRQRELRRAGVGVVGVRIGGGRRLRRALRRLAGERRDRESPQSMPATIRYFTSILPSG